VLLIIKPDSCCFARQTWRCSGPIVSIFFKVAIIGKKTMLNLLFVQKWFSDILSALSYAARNLMPMLASEFFFR